MKTIALTAAASFLLSFSVTCFAETLEGHLLPSKCRSEDPATHSKECALACKSSGFGLLTPKGDYLVFNTAGNAKAVELLESTKKTDDLKITVQGSRQGSQLDVETIAWK